METKREGLGTRFMAALNRVIRDNAPPWREPPLPGLAPSPAEESIAQGWRAYHAETDRIAAERLPKERPAPVTEHENNVRAGHAEARYHARELMHGAEYVGLAGREDLADKLLAEARDMLKREGLDNQGRPLDQERYGDHERGGRTR